MVDDFGRREELVDFAPRVNVPHGIQYTDVADCGPGAFTQAPSWFTHPTRVHRSPPSVLADDAWQEESEWVRREIQASGCSCCHASSSGSGNTSGFDVDAPGVWTDSMTNRQLYMSSGLSPLHELFGHFPADENHGFSRDLTLFPSTDPERMRAFFHSEFLRRGGDEADIEDAATRLESLFGNVIAETGDCFEGYEGVRADGTVFWSEDRDIRQLWVMEVGSESPAFPPSHDRPEGTLWALYVDPDGTPIESDTLRVGEVPEGARQVVPEQGAFALSPGQTYKLFATADVMVGTTLNCTFTYQETADD